MKYNLRGSRGNLKHKNLALSTFTWTFVTLSVDKNRHFWTTYPPRFVHVVTECPNSTLDAKTVDAIKRKCYFREERTLDYYTNYTRSNCLLECSFKFIKSVCGCVPYYFPSKSA